MCLSENSLLSYQYLFRLFKVFLFATPTCSFSTMEPFIYIGMKMGEFFPFRHVYGDIYQYTDYRICRLKHSISQDFQFINRPRSFEAIQGQRLNASLKNTLSKLTLISKNYLNISNTYREKCFLLVPKLSQSNPDTVDHSSLKTLWLILVYYCKVLLVTDHLFSLQRSHVFAY